MSEKTVEEYLNYTIKVFQPRSTRPLTREDARALKDTAIHFFGALEDLRKSTTNPTDPDKPQ